MGKKEFLKQIRSLEERKREHENKVKSEQGKASPDYTLIKYWQREITAFDDALKRAGKRLRRTK